MAKRFTIASRIALLSGALLVACGGDHAIPVSPLVLEAPASVGVVRDTAGTSVRPVQREAALAADASWSFDAGPDGAVGRDVVTGLTVVIPKGAVSQPTRITVTALRGSSIAYRFEPHGLQFAAPVVLTQSLQGLKLQRNALGLPSIIGGYFSEDSLMLDPATGTVRVRELLPVWMDANGRNIRLNVQHFSGYTVASAVKDSTTHGAQ